MARRTGLSREEAERVEAILATHCDRLCPKLTEHDAAVYRRGVDTLAAKVRALGTAQTEPPTFDRFGAFCNAHRVFRALERALAKLNPDEPQEGREAEELRAGIERLLEESDGTVSDDQLVALLDRVDARDSLSVVLLTPRERERVAVVLEEARDTALDDALVDDDEASSIASFWNGLIAKVRREPVAACGTCDGAEVVPNHNEQTWDECPSCKPAAAAITDVRLAGVVAWLKDRHAEAKADSIGSITALSPLLSARTEALREAMDYAAWVSEQPAPTVLATYHGVEVVGPAGLDASAIEPLTSYMLGFVSAMDRAHRLRVTRVHVERAEGDDNGE